MMDAEMRGIAVIVPIYNQASYLRRCLDSLARQTDGDALTFICVNDGSTDESQSIIDEYVAKDRRFVGIRKANGGLSSARNAGLDAVEEMADIDAVMFLDSDDFLHVQCIEAVRRVAAEHADAVIEYRFTGAVDPGEFAARKYDLSSVLAERDRPSGTVWNKLYPRTVLGKMRFVEEIRYSEDIAFTTELELKVRPAVFRIPLELHYYSDNPDSMTRVKFDAENFRRRTITVECMLKAFADDPEGRRVLVREKLPSLLKRFYRDLRRNVQPDEYAEARRIFAVELASLRRRGFLHPNRSCIKDVKYYLIFICWSFAFGRGGGVQ